ncbi:MAG: M23 family metallopeptidase [Candidatus Portnoybacteria bacterium]|nr:M23 family metallopeptidase [Candidatus Portnoybacteria bacterium]
MKKLILKKVLIFAIIILVLAVGFIYWQKYQSLKNTNQSPILQNQNQDEEKNSLVPPNQSKEPLLKPPLSLALERVTKKPFGIFITPENSPVSPEKFSGYHTGADFEILAGEENIDVPVYAVCAGPFIFKQQVQGYGGVVIQQCELESQVATIIYGHLKLSGIAQKIGQEVLAGEKIGVLGTGFSQETDGERKHLHLGIRKGTNINLRGYVQDSAELVNWIDASEYLE